MAKTNVLKLVAMMTVMHLIIVAAAAVDNHDQHFSPKCLLKCALQCAHAGIKAPLCFAKCLLCCDDHPAVSDSVRNCTSTCAQSICSKYVGYDMKTLEECVANECAWKCISGA